MNSNTFDVIIIGGSYSGLSAAMALGRSLQKVLVIDSGNPCNRQTPHSHNLVTHDGQTPAEVARLARQQVQQYRSVEFMNDLALNGSKTPNGFEITTASNKRLTAKRLVFATGIRDIMPSLEGIADCWGISVLHCPFCHGYEVRNERTGILGNGEYALDFSMLISNWTPDLTLFTDGPSTLTTDQATLIKSHRINIIDKEISKIAHNNGQVRSIVFKDNTTFELKAIYTKVPFEQHCLIPQQLGCELNDDGYIKVDGTQKTTVPGVFACGDNTTRVRSLSNAIAQGGMAGMSLIREVTAEKFYQTAPRVL
jgi:thioredoxin reductase